MKYRIAGAAPSALCLIWALGSAMAAPGADVTGLSMGGPPMPGQGCEQAAHPGPPRPPVFFEMDRPPPYLMGIKLTEEQQDKVFSILHAAAPEFREHMKAARKAREALRDMSQSPAYDANKAAALAQSEASAESQLTLLHARTDHDIFLVLTTEQRTQVADHRRQHDEHPGAEPPPR